MEIIGIGSGIYEAMGKLTFGIVYYCAMLVITFGIKVIITRRHLSNLKKIKSII